MVVIVVCAYLKKKKKVLLCTSQYKDSWEFPGGEVCENEIYEEALFKRVREKTGIKIKIVKFMDECYYKYPSKHMIYRLYEVTCHDYLYKFNKPNLKWISLKKYNKVVILPPHIILIKNILINENPNIFKE